MKNFISNIKEVSIEVLENIEGLLYLGAASTIFYFILNSKATIIHTF